MEPIIFCPIHTELEGFYLNFHTIEATTEARGIFATDINHINTVSTHYQYSTDRVNGSDDTLTLTLTDTETDTETHTKPLARFLRVGLTMNFCFDTFRAPRLALSRPVEEKFARLLFRPTSFQTSQLCPVHNQGARPGAWRRETARQRPLAIPGRGD